jgi:O-antigen/teichoic acid export membrane protein
VCGWLPESDPMDAAQHGTEAAGFVGPAGLQPDAEVGLGPVEQAAIEQQLAAQGTGDEPEINSAEVRRLAIRGIGQLLVRTVSLRAVTFGGNIILARILDPTSFGLFAIVNFVVLIAGFLADLGMGASLVQRKEALTEKDLRTAFSLGLIVDTVMTVLIIGLAPVLVHAYGLDAKYVTAIRAMGATIFVATFAAIPAIRLERTLRFKELANADLVSQLVYVTGALIGAVAGLHVWAFVIASIAARTIHTVIVNFISPWRPRWGIDRRSARSLLAFGVPYQLNGLMIQVKDNFVPTFIALVAGAKAVGYINWAVGLATNPFFLLTIVSRVTFPAYARLQHDLPALKDAVEKSIKWIAATVFPGTFLLIALAHQIVRFLYGHKWAPGLISFYFLSIPVLCATWSTVLISALYGMGRAKTVLKIMAIWTVAGWGLSVPLTLWLGYNGFAISTAIVSVLSILPVIEMNKIVKITFVRTCVRFAILSAIPAFAVWVMSYQVVHGIPSLLALAGFGGLAYLGLLALTGEITEARSMVRGSSDRPVPQEVKAS